MERTAEEQQRDWDIIEKAASAKSGEKLDTTGVVKALSRIALDERTTPKPSSV